MQGNGKRFNQGKTRHDLTPGNTEIEIGKRG